MGKKNKADEVELVEYADEEGADEELTASPSDIQEHAFEMICTGASILGWDMSFPDGNDDEPVPYLILGTPEAVEEIVDKLESESLVTAKPNFEGIN